MSAEKIILEILARYPETTKEKILTKLEKEKARMNGLVSDDVLLRVIGAEFGLDFAAETLALTLSSTDLVPGLSGVTFVGRVVAVFSPRSFEGKRSGEIASVLLADGKGIMRVVFWNDKTDTIKTGKIKTGQIVRFLHAYTKEGFGGKVELHLGEKSEIETNPSDVENKDYPTIEKFATKIGQISTASRNRRVNLLGSVKEVFPSSKFVRQDSSSGKVMHFTLADESDEISVVVWNEKVDQLENLLRKGLRLVLVDAKVRKAIDEGLEVHVDSGTYVESIGQTERFQKITDLKISLGEVNVEGEVASKPLIRDVKTSTGEVVRLAVFELKDESGKIWFSAWRTHVEPLSHVKIGSRVIVKNAYVRKGFGGQLELSTRETTTIAVTS